MASLEFFFDCSSPWTYLAFSRIPALLQRTGASIVWRPILVGGVFNAVNASVYQTRANPEARKASYYEKDLADWARFCAIRIGKPPVFPVRAVGAMRGTLAADEKGKLVPFAQGLFETYWGDLKDISQPEILSEVASRAGLDPAWLLARIADTDIKEKLKANTDELIGRGGFGSPTMFVDGQDMYFGNDRLPLVQAALMR
ncbi:MAG TPA: 2-hydroxychromene-2-carboxylate isomerase [Rhizomicrobium sp.]|nr:2-hydroxychromene-2-carboxylate isomerase [Rhizomicrobium sp.]